MAASSVLGTMSACYTRPSSPLFIIRSANDQPSQTPSFMKSHQVPPLICETTLDKGLILGNLGKFAATAAVAATVLLTDPALAFKGGGPYGQEVTRGLDLSGRDFSGRNFTKQDFKASILRQVNFKGAKLLGASFFDADLTGADLSDADLRGADFSLTNAAKANFTNANLEGALVTGNTSFKGAVVTGADFTDVLFRDDQRKYLCQIADGINSVTGNATRDTIGCD